MAISRPPKRLRTNLGDMDKEELSMFFQDKVRVFLQRNGLGQEDYCEGENCSASRKS